jgi:hypothetical protein
VNRAEPVEQPICKRRTGIEPASSPWKGEALPLSYHRARETCSKSCAPTMTVCTNYVAHGDLIEYGLPVTVGEAAGDVEVLMPEMVELEDERVGLTAVDAGLLAEELDERGGALRDEHPFSASGVRDVALAMRRIVLVFVGGPARAAVVVAVREPCDARRSPTLA